MGNSSPKADQKQRRQPGRQAIMDPQPATVRPQKPRLENKIAIVTGGDSGIGRAVAVAFAQEGADVVIAYLEEHEDAATTQRIIEEHHRRCFTVAGDVGDPSFANLIVRRAVEAFGRIDILVNNAGEQHPARDISDISPEQLARTFRTNVFSMFYLVKAALPHMRRGGAIVNTASVTAYKGSPHLLDYAASKGAIVAFTRSLSQSLVDRGIRVNAVAPGPIWTPLIAATFRPEDIESFGKDTPMQRPGQPEEVAPAYVFLASDDASYMSGQVLHPNGGEIVNT